MAYSLPREAFALLETAFNHDREKAEIFARAIEESIRHIETQADERIGTKTEALKSGLYNELRTELATKEFVRAEGNALRAEFQELRAEFQKLRAEYQELRVDIRQNALLLKVLIGIAVFGLTLFNPSFVKLVEFLTTK